MNGFGHCLWQNTSRLQHFAKDVFSVCGGKKLHSLCVFGGGWKLQWSHPMKNNLFFFVFLTEYPLIIGSGIKKKKIKKIKLGIKKNKNRDQKKYSATMLQEMQQFPQGSG